ncbi:hypothetical protein [Amycolatopsis sp. cmx-8-4]|uniref:hypothetical protein n=1 Tax=Amycolatopsis sp. cmx-8-4 TaxID=2790947 RepID=UPI00397CF703
MNESRRAGTPAELARTLLATARSAATAALRAGLEGIEERHGQHVADEVAGLIDVAEVYGGLADHDVRPRGRADRDDRDDDGPWEFKPVSAV